MFGSCWALLVVGPASGFFLARGACLDGVGVMKETNSILYMEVFIGKQNRIWKAGCALSAKNVLLSLCARAYWAMLHTSHVPLKTIFSTAILFDHTPNWLSGSLSIILGFPPFPVFLSFACRHLVGLVLSTLPAMPLRIRQAMCSTSKQNQHRL